MGLIIQFYRMLILAELGMLFLLELKQLVQTGLMIQSSVLQLKAQLEFGFIIVRNLLKLGLEALEYLREEIILLGLLGAYIVIG